MARGWESKSIEAQQDEALRPKLQAPPRSPEELARAARRSSLELALAQTQAEMIAACQPAHREMLSLRLAAIKTALAGVA